MIAINVFLKKKKRAHMNIGLKTNLRDFEIFVTNFEPFLDNWTLNFRKVLTWPY